MRVASRYTRVNSKPRSGSKGAQWIRRPEKKSFSGGVITR
jgi:hypothetical protein